VSENRDFSRKIIFCSCSHAKNRETAGQLASTGVGGKNQKKQAEFSGKQSKRNFGLIKIFDKMEV
jgi:hypothetical protein